MANLITNKLTSLQVEKQLLGGIYNHPDVLLEELDTILKETDFSNTLNETLYAILKQSILDNKPIDKVLWAQKFKDLKIGTRDEIENIFEYVDAICSTKLNKKGCINNAKELIKLRIRRDVYEDANEVQNFITSPKCSEKSVVEIMNEVDGIYNKRIDSIHFDDEPVDMFAQIPSYLIESAKNPTKESGLITPFNQYNKFFGGLKKGDGTYVFCARLGEGKSVWLYNLSKGVASINRKKVLYLDTEMSLKMNMDRASAAQTRTNPWYFQNGQWNKNTEIAEKVMGAIEEFKKLNGLFYYKYVPNKSIKEIISIARKWKLKYVGRDEDCLVILDYLKMVGNSEADRNEWQAFGDSISYLNEFGAAYNATTAAGAQQNRTGNQNGVRLDDDTTIGGSDRIGQFARFAGIIRRRTMDEVAEVGTRFGSHIFKPIKWSRDQGEEDYNQNAYIKMPEGSKKKYDQNYINLIIDQYDIREAGTLKDIIEYQTLSKNLDVKKKEDKSVNL